MPDAKFFPVKLFQWMGKTRCSQTQIENKRAIMLADRNPLFVLLLFLCFLMSMQLRIAWFECGKKSRTIPEFSQLQTRSLQRFSHSFRCSILLREFIYLDSILCQYRKYSHLMQENFTPTVMGFVESIIHYFMTNECSPCWVVSVWWRAIVLVAFLDTLCLLRNSINFRVRNIQERWW